jgi:hypothetical protein
MLANVLDWMGENGHPILAIIPGGKLPKKGLLKDVVKRAEARKRG